MTTIQISIDEQTADAIRQKAQSAGKSPEAWAADLISQHAAASANGKWISEFLASADQVRGNSGGRKWTREELHER